MDNFSNFVVSTMIQHNSFHFLIVIMSNNRLIITLNPEKGVQIEMVEKYTQRIILLENELKESKSKEFINWK